MLEHSSVSERTARRAFVVCGNAGAGKTTYGRKLANEHSAALFDIDSLSERLVQVGLHGYGLSPDDRDSPEYKSLFRDAIHETLFAAADDNLDHLPCVIVAPFTIERRRPTWVDELRERLRAEVRVFVVHCEPEERRRRLAARGNARDHAKLNDWGRYVAAGVDPARPPFEHTWVDTSNDR